MTEIKHRMFLVRTRAGLARKAFAEAIGEVAAIETGAQRVDHLTLTAICHRFEINANWLLFGGIDDQTDNTPAASFVQIPGLSVFKKHGNGVSIVGDQMDVTYYAFNIQWIKRRGLAPKELHAIEVKGDSMEPKL